MFAFLQFYITLVAALFAAQLALAAFAIPYILNNVKVGAERAALFFLLCLLPVSILFVIGFALTSVKKEYEKLIEHLTSEQKVETALGLMLPLEVLDPPSASVPYQGDGAFLYQRWIDGRNGLESSSQFVTTTVERSVGGAFAPLRRTLWVVGITDAVLLAAIVTWAVILAV